MRMIHVLRKPLSEGTVAANTLKHGCGGLNIDDARIASPGESIQTHSRSPEASAKENRPVYGEYGPLKTHQTEGQKRGRWPANVILQHLDGCRCEGVKRICESGCPVARLDEQSGVIKGVVRQPTGKAVYPTEGVAMNWNSNSVIDTTVRGFGDTGGASRFYKQVGGSDE